MVRSVQPASRIASGRVADQVHENLHDLYRIAKNIGENLRQFIDNANTGVFFLDQLAELLSVIDDIGERHIFERRRSAFGECADVFNNLVDASGLFAIFL